MEFWAKSSAPSQIVVSDPPDGKGKLFTHSYIISFEDDLPLSVALIASTVPVRRSVRFSEAEEGELTSGEIKLLWREAVLVSIDEIGQKVWIDIVTLQRVSHQSTGPAGHTQLENEYKTQQKESWSMSSYPIG